MEKTVNLYSIAFDCPKLDRNKLCPLKKVENLSFKEKTDWVDSLDEWEKDAILKHHRYCTKQEE